jgi:S-adenosylmethionine hydrolase
MPSGNEVVEFPNRVLALSNSNFWHNPVAPTFHRRDTIASVAGDLLNCTLPDEFGPSVSELVQLPWEDPMRLENGVRGILVTVGSFGNVLTNLIKNDLPEHCNDSLISFQIDDNPEVFTL